jgi:hypothetical protein
MMRMVDMQSPQLCIACVVVFVFVHWPCVWCLFLFAFVVRCARVCKCLGVACCVSACCGWWFVCYAQSWDKRETRFFGH